MTAPAWPYRFAAFVALLLAALAVHAQPAALPAGVTRGASVEGVTEYRLDNGLRVLLMPDPTNPSTRARPFN